MSRGWVYELLFHLFFCARLGDGSSAPSLGGLSVDGRGMPFSSTATHDPTGIPKSLWARRKPLDATSKHKLMRMSI